MDGLAAGVALIATVFLAALLGPSLGDGLFVLLIALAGALRVFSTGTARVRGCSWATAAACSSARCSAGVSLVPVFHARIAFVSPTVLAVLILVVPLFDTAFVLVLRRLAGRRASRGGTDHVSHRLVSLGFSERSAVRILYLLGLRRRRCRRGSSLTWNSDRADAAAGGGLRRAGHPVRHLPRACPRLQRRGLHRAAEIVVRAVPQGPRVQVARRRGDARSGPDHGLLLRSVPPAFRRRRASTFSCRTSPHRCRWCSVASLRRSTRSGLYQRSWETFGLRDLPRSPAASAWDRCFRAAVAYYLYRGEGSRASCSSLDAVLLTLAILATRASFRTMNLVASTRNKRIGACSSTAPAGSAAARARDARQPGVEHEPGRFHRRRPDEGAPLDRRRAGARLDRRARGRRCASIPSTKWC